MVYRVGWIWLAKCVIVKPSITNESLIMELEKTCSKHGALAEKDIFVKRRAEYKNGIQLKCKKCEFEQKIRQQAKTCKIHGLLKVDEMYENGRCKRCHRATANAKRDSDPIAKAARNAREKLVRNLDLEKYNAKIRHYRSLKPKGHRIKEVLQLRGITADQYAELVKDHDNKCGICGMPETRPNPKNTAEIGRLCIDHDHDTNTVRGLLCHSCNVAVGLFKENMEVMYNAISYLEYWSDKKLIE